MKMVTVAGVLTAAALVVQGADAQVLETLESPSPEDDGSFGCSVSGAGDVNNDGYDDIIVGAYREDGGASDAGRAYVFGGGGGPLLCTLVSPCPQGGLIAGCFGWSVSGAGDADDDGYDDVIVGAYQEDEGTSPGGRAHVFSGQTGDILYTLVSPDPLGGYFGYSVASVGDVNGDGHADMIVGAPCDSAAGLWGAGKAYVFGGVDGELIYALHSPVPQAYANFGISVSGVGDVDDDGCPDLAVGTYCEDGGATYAGTAYIFGGSDGSPLYALQSPMPEDQGGFGLSLSAAGDLNGDGYHDVAVGARWEDSGATDAGRTYVFSGGGGGLLLTLQSPNPEQWGLFGCSVGSLGDVNNDGYDDVVVGAVGEDYVAAGNGRAYIFGGDGGELLYTLTSPSPENYARFGCSVSGAGDLNGDGIQDAVVGAAYEDGGARNAGRAYVFNGIEVPIELASFTGEPCEAGVRLAWLTLTERDNLGFNVDRALDRTGAFVRLNGQVIPGAGTSTVPHSYEYLDRAVHPGAVYRYRLEDVSLDGKRTLHGPIHVAVPDRPELGLQVLGGPDPAFVLKFERPGRASLRLYDVRGKLVATLWEGEARAGGSTTVQPEVRRELPTGLYTASLEQSDRAVRRPVAVAR